MRFPLMLSVLIFIAGRTIAAPPVMEVSVQDKSAKDVPGVVAMDHFRETNGVIQFHVISLSSKSGQVTVKVNGLKGTEYALYFDSDYKGMKNTSELQEGLTVDLKPAYVQDAYSDYLQRFPPRIKVVNTPLSNTTEGDPKKVYDVLQSADSWVASVTRSIHNWKAVNIRLVPFGSSAAQVNMPKFETPEFARQNDIVTTLFYNLHRIRVVMSQVKDLSLREKALAAVTPIDLQLTTSANLEPGATVEATVKLTNPMDMPISGKLCVDAPVGWEVQPKGDTSYKDIGMGQSSEAKFTIKVSKDAAPGAALIPAAEVRFAPLTKVLGEKTFHEPGFWFRMNAKTVTP